MRLRMFTLPLFATTLMLGSLLITMTWHLYDNLNVMLSLGVPRKHDAPSREQDSPLKQDDPLDKALQPLNNCENCSAIIKKVMEIYSKPWKKQEGNYLDFRFKEPQNALTSNCMQLKGLLSSSSLLLDHHVEPRRQPPQRRAPPKPSKPCKGCRELVKKVVKRYAEPWKKQEDNYQNFSSLLSSQCQGAERAIVTQANTPLGSMIVYSGEAEKTIEVTPDLFHTFIKENPFSAKKWDTCSVVGNGGILADSKCGKQIDSAQFVIRCNLAPLEKEWERHVGKKTDLVTANPSIFMERFKALDGHRRPFVESLRCFGSSLLLLPTFSYSSNTPVCLRAVYSLQDFNSPLRPVAFNPDYLQSLDAFWRAQGLKESRLSTGMIMVNLALELCNNVNLYGFWPFNIHPDDQRTLNNHYYDNSPARKKYHSMPAEFDHLLKLHSQGVLRLHLGNCTPQKAQ